jgi:hypothetical protein
VTDIDTQKIDFSQYEKKKVIITIGDPDDTDKSTEEYEGTILVVTPVAVMFKPKGAAGQSIFMRENVLACQLLVGKTKIIQKHLRPVELGQIRQHLVDRHGFTISWANEQIEDTAAEVHAQQHVDVAAELGHDHKQPAPTPREQAIAGAEVDPTDTEIEEENEIPDEEIEGQERLF